MIRNFKVFFYAVFNVFTQIYVKREEDEGKIDDEFHDDKNDLKSYLNDPVNRKKKTE